MKLPVMHRILAAALAAGALAAAAPAAAQLASIADTPLAQSPSTSVKPNLMYILDDSGSMAWNWMPDQIFRTSASVTYYHCRKCVTNTVKTATTSSSTITLNTSVTGLTNRQQIMFYAGTLPTGLTAGVPYFVRNTNGSTTTQLENEAGTQVTFTSNTTGASLSICSYSGGGDSSGTPASGFPCGNDTSGGASALPDTSTIPQFGDPPYYANAFNKIWYTPDTTYSPAVDSLGNSYGNSPPATAKNDFYTDPTTNNMTNGFQELVYCTTSAPTTAQIADTTVCRYNGRHNTGTFVSATAPNYFLYNNYTVQNGLLLNMGYPNNQFNQRVVASNSPAQYYNILPNEYCSDVNLTTCALATSTGAAPDATNTIPAQVRWCKTMSDSALSTVVTGTSGSPATPRCRKKFDKTNYPYPRFGRFQRVDIVSTTPTYPKSATSTRSDCAAATYCTYAEEIQNFANWYSYYRFRLSLMKTATGKAFLSIDDRFRVGFITINPNNPVTTSKFVPAAPFSNSVISPATQSQRALWYQTLYAQATNGGTPLREALSRVGRYYAGVTGGINTNMTPDPMQYSCQTNYALLTTDGYWNGNAGQNISGGGIGNQDNTNGGYSTRAFGAYDGNLSGSSDTLADVAMYYYATDLRTSGLLAPDNVPTNTKDTNPKQHMVTFTLGLGLEGFMDYRPDYETATTGDFAKIKAGTTGCAWTSGTCDWPSPVANDPSTLDDLWHAAVNGRGTYFSAGDPNSLALGLQTALSKLKVATAAASASATSSPNVTQTDNFIFSSTFRTGAWDGEIIAQHIDVNTGLVLPTVAWSAQAPLDGRTTGNSDSRVIFTIDEASGGKMKPFQFASLKAAAVGPIAAEQPYFANQCGAMAQCTLLTVSQKAIAQDGNNLVGYLRGQRQYESFNVANGEAIAPFRTRDHVFGDPVNSTPTYVADPHFRFGDPVTPLYDTFKTNNLNRNPALYIGANDGMLHAFDGNSGQENWAYVPRMVFPRMAAIASANWSATHRYTVDGSPQTMDAYYGGNWHTVLVSGLNGGGRGYYALDVTDPANPTILWEICSDPTICAITDSDIGYTFGNPVIAKRAFDGKWVVFFTSGINNISPGTGVGFLYTVDLQTGAILNKVSTGFGTTAAPAGFTHISGYADDFTQDATAKFIYGGDRWGNVWKFDTSTNPPTRTTLATLKDATGKPQPITTKPELANISGFPVVYVGTGEYIGPDDLVDPATLTPAQPFAYNQSLYAIKDRGVTLNNFRTGSVTVNTIIDAGTTRTTSTNPVNWTTQDGWYVDFNPSNTSPGERVNIDPQLVQGTLAVITNVPNNSACSVGGDSWVYFFDYSKGTFVASSTGSVAGTKFTGQITVGFVVVRLPSGVFKGIATGASGTKTTVGVPTPQVVLPSRRIAWREIFSK